MRPPVLIAAALLAAALLPSRAANDVAQTQVASDSFVAGGTVRQSKPVEGDLFGVGGTFDLAAGVQGDAVLGGGDVRVSDRVEQDLFAGGGNVRVEAAVGGSARLAGGNVEITRQGSIGGNLWIGGGTIEIRGPVSGDVRAAGGNVVIDSAIAGDVNVAAGDLELGPNARIAGRLVHRGPEKVRQDPAAQVAGGLEQGSASGTQTHRNVRRASHGGWFWNFGLILLAAFIAGAFPTESRRMGEGLLRDPAIALLLGFIALACVPVAAMVLIVTIIGIPLALVLLLLYLLMLFVGYAVVAVVIGDAALARLRAQDAAHAGWRVGAAMAAMLVLVLLGRIPVLGGLVVFAALLAGVGAIAYAVRARTRTQAPPPAAA